MNDEERSERLEGVRKVLKTLDEGMKARPSSNPGMFEAATRVEVTRYTLAMLGWQVAVMGAIRALSDGRDPSEDIKLATEMVSECAIGASKLSGVDGLSEQITKTLRGDHDG